jgi:hypothetical protein
MQRELVYMGFVVSKEGLKMDPDKVNSILEWTTPRCTFDVRSFHGLEGFYRKFIRDFSQIHVPLIECMKKGVFQWTVAAKKSLGELKKRVTTHPILSLPNFNKVFQVDCDTSGTKIGLMISQEGRPIAFFSEKLNESIKKYYVYDQEFYAIVQALRKWRHYLLSMEFVLFIDHKDLQYINKQGKLNQKHTKWVEFLKIYSFVLKHGSGKSNKVVDALSRRTALLNTMSIEVVSLNCLKTVYEEDANFSKAWKECKDPWSLDRTPYLDYHIQEGVLFKNQHFLIPRSSIRLNLIKELHHGGLGGYCGMNKTTTFVKERYFWPSFNKDVRKLVEGCRICQLAKGKSQNTGLYTPLLVPKVPSEDINMDFVLGFPITRRKHDSSMVVVDRLSKMAHFIACKNTSDASEVASLFFQEVFKSHGLPRSITSNRNTRFLGHFWRTLWKNLGSCFLYGLEYHTQTDGQT